jgi:hypothetical protein
MHGYPGLFTQQKLPLERESVLSWHQPTERVVAWVMHAEEVWLRLVLCARPPHQEVPLRRYERLKSGPSSLAGQLEVEVRVWGDGVDDAEDADGECEGVWLVLEREMGGTWVVLIRTQLSDGGASGRRTHLSTMASPSGSGPPRSFGRG